MGVSYVVKIVLLGSIFATYVCKYALTEPVKKNQLFEWIPVDVSHWSKSFSQTHQNWLKYNIGKDTDGEPHYVGRVGYKGQIIPGKWEYTQSSWEKVFGTKTLKLWIVFKSKEILFEDYFDILFVNPCAVSSIVPANTKDPSDVPEGAVISGLNQLSELIYVGQMNISVDAGKSSILIPGQIVRSEGKMYGSYHKEVQEAPITNYLVIRPTSSCAFERYEL